MIYYILLAILFVLIVLSEITNDDVVEFKLSLVIMVITIGMIVTLTKSENLNIIETSNQDQISETIIE